MAKAALLFNGIKMSFAVIDQAITWAMQSHGSLVAIFLVSAKEPGEGYIFPSDLDAAENLSGDKDSKAGMQDIIASNRRIIEHRAIADKVELRSILLTDPSEKLLVEELGGCEMVFTAGDIATVGTMTQEGFNLPKWLEHSEVAVRQIQE